MNPMDDDQSVEEVQYDLDKPRIAPYKKNLETSSKHNVLVQFKARSREKIAVLSDTITRNRSPQHAACDLYWENVMHENNEWALPKSTSVSKVALCFFFGRIRKVDNKINLIKKQENP